MDVRVSQQMIKRAKTLFESDLLSCIALSTRALALPPAAAGITSLFRASSKHSQPLDTLAITAMQCNNCIAQLLLDDCHG